jgi:hypothetical protein
MWRQFERIRQCDDCRKIRRSESLCDAYHPFFQFGGRARCPLCVLISQELFDGLGFTVPADVESKIKGDCKWRAQPLDGRFAKHWIGCVKKSLRNRVKATHVEERGVRLRQLTPTVNSLRAVEQLIQTA